jgi:hypothetical protein
VPAALWAVGLTLAVGLVLLPLLVVVERALLRRGWA